MRKWGSFMGAGLAFALMKASDNNYRAIFLLAAGDEAVCVFVLERLFVHCVECCGVLCCVALVVFESCQVCVAHDRR
jgi:hypothetical protein